MMPFRVIDAAMRASGQLAYNFLTQASWRLYEIRLDCVQPLASLQIRPLRLAKQVIWGDI